MPFSKSEKEMCENVEFVISCFSEVILFSLGISVQHAWSTEAEDAAPSLFFERQEG